MGYKGFEIQPETEPWALKTGATYRWFIDGEKIHSATSVQDAIEQIDEEIAVQEYKFQTKQKAK